MTMRILLPLLIISFSTIVSANSASQTDWSGGPGTPGPIGPWGSVFDVCTNINYDTSPGILSLSLPYGEHNIDNEIWNANSIVIADFNGDGFFDVAAVGSDAIYWWENIDNQGFSWVRHLISSNGSDRSWLNSADFDDDGDIDLCASYSSEGLFWWENEGAGASWIERQISAFDARGSSVADIDSDGYQDIVLAVYDSEDIMWWRNKVATSHSWSPNYIDGAFSGALIVDAMDMNGSGRPDVVAGSNVTGQVAVWVNHGTYWEKDIVVAEAPSVHDLLVDDINGDGDYDVVVASNNLVSWWENINWTHWTNHTIDTPVYCYALASADLNDDGFRDLLIAKWGSGGEVHWMENSDGSGLSWTLKDSFSSRWSYDIATGDLNADGIPEFATPSWETQSTIQYFRIGGYDTPGELTSSIYDTGAVDEINWDYLHWDSEEPGSTDIQVQIRGSSDAETMGNWSAWLSGPTNLQGLLEPTDRYIQYNLKLTSGDPWITPKFNDITFLWSVTGISVDPTIEEPLVLMGCNPVQGSFQLAYQLTAPGEANLRIYDLTGREVLSPVSGWMDAGSHSTTVTGLPSGLYVCTYSAPETSAQLRVVVIN